MEVMSAMVSAASSSRARGAAPVHSVLLTRSFSEKMSRSVMLIAPFAGSVDGRTRFYVSRKCFFRNANETKDR